MRRTGKCSGGIGERVVAAEKEGLDAKAAQRCRCRVAAASAGNAPAVRETGARHSGTGIAEAEDEQPPRAHAGDRSKVSEIEVGIVR